jgi:hypothetical protein
LRSGAGGGIHLMSHKVKKFIDGGTQADV